MIHVLGISGSPVKDSNTEQLLKIALDSIAAEDVCTDMVMLSEKTVHDCIHCNWCLLKQEPEKFCSLQDDMQVIYPKILQADALIMATPVYIGRLSGHLAALLDRLRALDYGRIMSGRLKHKVGAGIAVSWYRNSGIETTLSSLHWAFLTWQMVIAGPGSISTFGGAAVSSLGGTGKFDPSDRHQVLRDSHGLASVRATAASLVELTKIIKKGKAGEALS